MNQNKLLTILYAGNASCLHSDVYRIRDMYQNGLCGPCYFRDGFASEIPTRMTIKELSGLFGSPQMDPKLKGHMMVVAGLIDPHPEEPLYQFRKRQKRLSQPNPKLFPFTSALWRLVGFQPPLARVMLRFVQGANEFQIADELDLSIYNVQIRLAKGARTAQGFLKL